MIEQQFAFAFEDRYRRLGRLFAVTPQTTSIVVSSGQLRVRFGPWRVATDLRNIASVSVTGPFAFVKTAGPARLAITDRGLTFATNSHSGVCLKFREPIVGIDFVGLLKHPNLTLTAADVAGLASSLTPA